MNILIKGHHLEISQAIKEYVMKRFEKLIQIFGNIKHIEIFLKIDHPKNNDKYHCEAIIHLKNHNLFAEIHLDDLYNAIDHLCEKCEHLLSHEKSKILHHMHHHKKHHEEIFQDLNIIDPHYNRINPSNQAQI